MSEQSQDPQVPRKRKDTAAPRAAPASQDEDDTPEHALFGERERQYLITVRRRPAFSMLGRDTFDAPPPDLSQIHSTLQTMSNVTVVRRIRSTRMALLGNGPSTGSQDILVVREDALHGSFLASLVHPGLIVEQDHLLRHMADVGPRLAPTIGLRPMSVVPVATPLRFRVQDAAGAPQAKCSIVLYTQTGGEAQGMTDEDGNATVTVPVGYINDILAIYVKPFADCWELFRYRPALRTDSVNAVQLKPLPAFSSAGFATPETGNDGFSGWGQRLMGLAGVARGQMTGRGVKVAIIDSGCDNTHPALTHVTTGLDYTSLDEDNRPNPGTWTTDTMSHGTHCAGVIGGNGKDGHIRGFVPDAEIHVLKLFPGGAFNNLAAALHYCIDNQIDVVNCSLGGEQTSEAIEQLIDVARQAGIAVIVAAGNSSGPVQFPGSVPGVLCVAAIGEQGSYPDDTYHAQTCAPGSADRDGLFSATFSCRGPQVSVCAPGVAVISSVPGGGYAAWDGTSMATPAVTGLVAMVLAHHPAFAGGVMPRNAVRVDKLFQIVAQAASRLPFPAQQSGAGIPQVPGTSTRAQDRPTETIPPWNGQVTQAQLESIVREAFARSLETLSRDASVPAF